MNIPTYEEFIKPINELYKQKKTEVILGYLKSPLTEREYEVRFDYPYGISVGSIRTCNGNPFEVYQVIQEYTDETYANFTWHSNREANKLLTTK